MQPQAIPIEFYGPYPFCTEDKDVLAECPYSQQSGIYLWVAEMPDCQYRISYIGLTTRSFYDRIKEHMLYQLGGYYRIYDPEALKKGELRIIWGGLWGKGRHDKYPDFWSQYIQLAPYAKELLSIQRILIAPLQCDKRLLTRIEGGIAKTIRECSESSSLLPQDVHYQYRINTETPVGVKLTLPCPVQGLPSTIMV